MIYILNSELKIVDILRKYSYNQFTEKFRDVGNFEIHFQMSDDLQYLFDEKEQYFFVFETLRGGNKKNILGFMDKISFGTETDYENEVTVTGRMSQCILQQRVINGTETATDMYSFEYIVQILNDNIPSDRTNVRYAPIHVEYVTKIPYIYQRASKVTKQITGGYILDGIEEILEKDKFGLTMYAVFTTSDETKDLSFLYCTVECGEDRRIGNTRGLQEVVFSQNLSNVAPTTYERDMEQFCNVAYIAGEGEGTERKWYNYSINDGVLSSNKWFNRRELWIDARDIQSEQDDKTLSDSEYEKLIKQRVEEKAVEVAGQKSYEATVAQQTSQFKFGIDYDIGDFVTILDTTYGIMIDAQVLEVTHTLQGDESEEIIDVTFGYGKQKKMDIARQLREQKEQIQANNVNIKYISDRLKKLS